MPALGFQERFAPAVERGEKRQTIRRVRKRPIKVGDTLYLKTGMRTAKCRSLGTAICTKVTPIRMSSEPRTLGSSRFPYRKIVLGTRQLRFAAANRLARKDGFFGAAEMIDWFERQYGLPFEGVVIYFRRIESS